MVYSLAGIWQADIGDDRVYSMKLPGTLDENGIGGRDAGGNQWHPDITLGNPGEGFTEGRAILTRFTRKHAYEGEARLMRHVSFVAPQGKRIFLEVERARCLKLFVDGQEIPDFRTPTISTPHVFEITDVWRGEHELTLLSDNSYPGLPYGDITASSAATDETQTNWNGVLGYFRLRTEEPVFLEAVRVYPKEGTLTVKVSLCAADAWKGKLGIVSDALEADKELEVSVQKGDTEIVVKDLRLAADVARWDEYEGNLYELTAVLDSGEKRTVSFGVRDFGSNAEGRLALNGRTIFLRSEANCAEFPETGYCPMSVDEWIRILELYKSYGVNCVRFHSHCPPEAAFMAADQMGILMQPELSHWNPKDAFETEESAAYYREELFGVISMLANHPSFVMLTFGNELHASKLGHMRMDELLAAARKLDGTRLYANGSNVHYGTLGCDGESDFYTSSNYLDQPLRGTFSNMKGYMNHCCPSAKTNYNKTMERLRETYQKPVFSFEVGQFEVLPDFGELAEFQGISEPANICRVKERVEECGLMPVWTRYVEATGELAKICYREEIEAAMRTEQLSGISLLGLQDFPGQGTALVGMMNSHLEPKPYAFASPESFRSFFRSQLPLALLPKYTYENTEILEAEIQIANYGKADLEGRIQCTLQGENFSEERRLAYSVYPTGGLTDAGTLRIPLAAAAKPLRLNLTISIGKVSNCYPVWVYPPVTPACPETVCETSCLDERAQAALEAGKTVYLTPPSTKEALPDSIQAQFTTDFWSVGTFPGQEGGMGQLIDAAHPVFRNFPTESHTDWQWWHMASQRAVILPEYYQTIIAEMDSYAYLRPMAQLLECRCGNGKLLFSAMGLQDLQEYPEARALLASVYQYMDSAEFQPKQEIPWDVLKTLVWQK